MNFSALKCSTTFENDESHSCCSQKLHSYPSSSEEDSESRTLSGSGRVLGSKSSAPDRYATTSSSSSSSSSSSLSAAAAGGLFFSCVTGNTSITYCIFRFIFILCIYTYYLVYFMASFAMNISFPFTLLGQCLIHV